MLAKGFVNSASHSSSKSRNSGYSQSCSCNHNCFDSSASTITAMPNTSGHLLQFNLSREPQIKSSSEELNCISSPPLPVKSFNEVFYDALSGLYPHLLFQLYTTFSVGRSLRTPLIKHAFRARRACWHSPFAVVPWLKLLLSFFFLTQSCMFACENWQPVCACVCVIWMLLGPWQLWERWQARVCESHWIRGLMRL